MKRYNKPIDLTIEYKSAPAMKGAPDDATSTIAGHDIQAEMKAANIPIEQTSSSATLPPLSKGFIGDPTLQNTITVKTLVEDTEIHPWDLAHAAFNSNENYKFIEPDLWQEYTTDEKLSAPYNTVSMKSFGSTAKGDELDADWPPTERSVWHLDDTHSQLRSARNSVANLDDYIVRIGHLDTGYTEHHAIPQHIRDNRYQRNFIEGENASKAMDIGSTGTLKQPYHGTGTLSILAGGKVQLATANGTFDDFLGGAYFAEVVSCRISKSVVLFKSGAFAEALNYLTGLSKSGYPIHVVSMSMGGAPSKAWADAVNAAYEAGITVVTAAGNNFDGLPVRHLVYPARFQRVIAACGATHDYAPYYTKLVNEMQGNYGPPKDMQKALAAYTPNVPWASFESASVQFSGAGTSSATPQIAAAAAIYYKKYHKELDALKEPWMRVEAIRHALYSTAKQQIKPGFGDYSRYFGNGIVQAAEALKVPVNPNVEKTPEDSCPWFPILNTLFKTVPDERELGRLDMFNTELWQQLYSYPELAKKLDGDNIDFNEISSVEWDSFANAVIVHPNTSRTLKAFLKEKLNS